MSFQVLTTTEKFPQKPFQFVPYFLEEGAAFEDFPVLGSLLSDLKHFWHAKGPCLEVRHVTTGRKVGSFTFGCVLKDTNTKIIAVEELKRSGGRLSLLVVALDCALTGGVICVFDIFGSKVLRAVQVGERISCINVIDDACEAVFPESSPLKYFDGLLAVGTLGGNVFLLDLCKQICENALENFDLDVRGEVNSCQMVVLSKQKIQKIKKYIEISVELGEHLAIHLNVVLDSPSEHFTLKGERGDDRVHVNKEEAEVSALFYGKQIASLFVGYNFGSFQMWDLRSLDLLYTSPLCDGIIPVTNFAIQEPADDPKSVCYIWVSFSHNILHGSGLPYAVLYAFYFNNRVFVNKFGSLYEDFQHCSIRFQLALGDTRSASFRSSVKGGVCLGLQSITKHLTNKDSSSLELCLISWLFWDSDKTVSTAVLLFDLNQWYKQQMPATPSWMNCSNYIVKNSVDKKLMSVRMDRKSLCQFIGIQRPEEHFCPTSLSFDLWAISEQSIFKIHNKGHQKLFLDKVLNDQHLALVNPVNYTEEIKNLGLIPLFYDLRNCHDADYQRKLLLNVALEQKLVGWLCKVTSELANNAFSAAGLTLHNMLNWAFQRAVAIKNSCDQYCVPLFDYSGIKLDNNILSYISCGTHQIKNLCCFYRYISSKLLDFVADKEGLLEEQRSLENVVVYFEVLLWMVNVGLLPEFQAKCEAPSLIGAPYLVRNLTEYYNQKRAQLQLASKDTFVEKDCLIFIDNLINSRAIVDTLRQKWQEDGGSGLYPPPSLQSLLRTYLLDGPDLVFKHSLVAYTFLDIAMTLDQHNEAVKLLLKFPQNFNVSQSNVKIVQGFWHLDHDDYETALDCILDASVSPEDLKPWHHSVMMKTLLTRDRSNLALWYLQVRKPAVQDEKDLLTVISLLVSKNLLDEAFEFRLRHRGPNDYDLLNHIFNECNKNELLHSLLCRSFTAREEQAFLKYLQSTKNAKCEDLKMFYYLLRSRFLEAFDAYALTKRRQPDSQGLIGQREASTADNLVQMYKSLLPDVNSKLVELVRKERANLWKEVPKPKPLSVFVHNAKDKVRYKSSVHFAALSRAKQTFNDTKTNDIVTEDTPFLRTPVVSRIKAHESTPVLKYKILGDDDGASPAKKRKLSPRASKSSPNRSRNVSSSIVQNQLSTPIIVRHKRQTMDSINDTAVLPPGILKSSTILESSIFNENWLENSSRRSALGLSPRTSVRGQSAHVKFSGIGSSDSSSLNNSGNLEGETKNSLEISVEEVFYSPEHSFEERNKSVKDDEEKASGISVHQSKEKLNFDDSTTGDEQPTTSATPADVVTDGNTIPVEENRFEGPKCRKSYRNDTHSPIRFSARLAKKTSEENSSTTNSEESIIKSSPSSVQKWRGRRSLSRAVLENNLLKSQNPPVEELQLSFSSLSDISFNDSSLASFLGNDQSPRDCDTSHENVVSKVVEVTHVEIHRESSMTKETVSTKETKEEFHSKTIEEFREEEIVEEAVEKDAQESLGNVEQQCDSGESDNKEEALNIYEDLSSASEDAKEALLNVTKEKELNASEVGVLMAQENLEVIFENDVEMLDVDEDIPETEKAFIATSGVIEIDSSSEEESNKFSPQVSWSSHDSSTGESESEQIFLGATIGYKPGAISHRDEEESSNQTSTKSERGSDVEDCDVDAEIAQQEESSNSERKSLAESCNVDAEEEYSNQNSTSSEQSSVAKIAQEETSTSEHSSLAKQGQVEGSSNGNSASECGSRNSEAIDFDKELSEHDSSNSSNEENLATDYFNAQIVKDSVGDDSDGSNSQFIEEEVLEQGGRESPVEDPLESSNSADTDCFDRDTSKEDENSDTDESSFEGKIVTPTKTQSNSECEVVKDSCVIEARSQNISPQDVEMSQKNSDGETSPQTSGTQSRSIQCTLTDTIFEKSGLPNEEEDESELRENLSMGLHTPDVEKHEPVEATTIKLRTVKRTYARKSSTSTNENVVADKTSGEDPSVVQSIGLQCSFGTPDVTAEYVEATTIKVKTVKKTYRGRKASINVDATPVLVSLPTRTYSSKVNVRLFDKNEDVDDATVQDMEGNVVAGEEIIHVGKDVGENKEIANTMEENVVAHEEIINIDNIVAHGNTEKNLDENVAVRQEIINNDNIVDHQEIVNIEQKMDVEDQKIASIEKDAVKLDATCSEQDKEINNDKHLLPLVTEEKKQTPIRMTRRRSLLMSQESSGSSANTNEKGDSVTTNSQSTVSVQSSNRRSKRVLSNAEETQDISPVKEGLVEQKVNILKKKEGTSKQKPVNKRTSKKIFCDIDAHNITIEPDLKEKESKTEEPANSTNVYTRRTTRTSKSRAASIASAEPTKKPPTKRTRSLSVDQPVTQKSNFRAKSVDLQNIDATRQLIVVLSPSDQITAKESKATSSKRSAEEKRLPEIEEIDPLNLLDKVEFKGQPDPDEAKVYEEDSPLPPSPGSYCRQTRSVSVLSNASSIKSRLRRASADTVVSEVSDSPSPPKKNKKKASAESVPVTRSRANSLSSLRSDASSTRNTRARSRQLSALEDIQEEKVHEEESKRVEKGNVKRRGRKRTE